MPTVLAIDDDLSVLDLFRIALQEVGIGVETAGGAREGLEKYAARRPDVVLLDVDMPELSGMEAFRRLHALDPRVPVIFVTGSGSTDTAIEAMALGAYDYLLKPVRLDQLCPVVERAIEVSRLMRVPAVVEPAGAAGSAADVLVGRSPAMQDVYKAIGRVAPQDVTVLILGETGTGKELVARAIYNYSRRAAAPFLAINCAAIPESLLESELFGHEKGAFTGADQKRIGKFEQCSGGTLFLDEVGDMTPLTQTKILRVLQEQEFERVGGGETVKTNVRLLAATNRNLETLVANGQLRLDLFYRLNVIAIKLPPLRERTGDLPILIDHFLKRFCRELGKEAHGLAPETLAILQRHAWPGNLRELQSVLKHALVQANGPVLEPEFLPEPLASSRGDAAAMPVPPASDWDRFIEERLRAGTQNLYAEWQALTDRRLLIRVLQQAGGNLSQAAKTLGIHRATLRTKIEALEINPQTDIAGQAGAPG
jgi:two-component system nitrogen regulation response regulator GlnG